MSDVRIYLLGTCRGDHCDDVARDWWRWASDKFRLEPPALVDVDGDYWAAIGKKSRNMVRKVSSRGYTFAPFNYNDKIGEMFDINVSLPERQGRPMTESYRNRPEPLMIAEGRSSCQSHQVSWVGGFNDEGRMMAYCQLVYCGQLAIINRILGHGDALKDGVMNGLVCQLTMECRERGVRWLNYLSLRSTTNGLRRFKESVGFRSYDVRFML